ncbi:S53 family peptidase [Geothrix sp. SG200]|uniref:S53 family peptidase n=1 Tax=Geothrix sp. SG200 TaxID=2922865 RepID=UPI001FAD7036|nr:S53 family peptidase [Geothrix sp. SG200]
MSWTKARSAILGFGLGLASLAGQEAPPVIHGDILIPETSLEAREDVGLRSHTNHLVLLRPAGGLGPGGGMSPTQLRDFYSLPATGGHDVIAIIDAYHYPTALSDFNTFSAQFGLPQEASTDPTASTNTVFQVVYQGGKKPRTNSGWALEAALDIEWAHALAPSAKIILVEAQSNSNANLYAAVDLAVSLAGVKQVSMSWGGSESSGETANDTHFNVNGPVFFAASGDTGGKTIYPSTSPYVVAVGGTSVATDANGAFTGETGWSSGGGGNSPYESKPSWQTAVAMTGSGRGVPDISSDGDPNTGVAVYDTTSYHGRSGWWVVGGTSVSSPCMAGMVNLGGGAFTNTTQLLTAIYTNYLNPPATPAFRDITSGNNGFPCLVGWDYVTGVGSPQGTGGF